MIDLTDYLIRAQIAFALLLIAFVVVWRFFVRLPVKKTK